MDDLDAATGRVVTQQYPTGFTVKYDYRPGTGFLNKVSNNATGAVYWTIDGLGDYPFDPGGKLVRQQANRRHIMEKKPTKRTRRLDGRTDVAPADVPRIKRLLGL